MANTLNLGNGNWATKEDSLLAYNSENGNFKPLPFDFTRASSATVVNKAGLIETVGSGKARIDFLGNTKGALLLEPQRSNLVTYSEAFDNAYWVKGGSSVASGFTSPNGSNNAFEFIEGTNNGSHNIYSFGSKTINIDYTVSIYVKSNGRNFFYIEFSSYLGVFNGGRAFFDLVNGVTAYKDANITSKIEELSNGYYRITATQQSLASGNGVISIGLSNTDGSFSYQGDGTSGVYIYGAQLEQGSYATSYIPTQGSAVTRVGDSCNNGGNEQVINSTEGVLMAEISALSNDLSWRGIQLRKIGDGDDQVNIGYNTTTQQVISQVRVAGSLQYNQSFTLQDITTSNKIAILYAPNNFKVYINGVLAGTHITTGVTFSANFLNTLEFKFLFGNSNFYGNVKDVRVYNTALTDAELQALTK